MLRIEQAKVYRKGQNFEATGLSIAEIKRGKCQIFATNMGGRIT